MKSLLRRNIELTAPAGSYESLMAAIQGGADSVYFGVEKLNMRSRSSYNFTMDDLQEIVSIAKKHKIKTYLAVNTIIYDSEIDHVRHIISKAKQAGIDAVIVSDQSAILAARDAGMAIHLSTQLNISNISSLKFYANYADVIVLARELTLEQVRHITSSVKEQKITGPSGELVRIELFVHGALCMARSGICYLSLHQYHYSANRGECLQACRRAYIVSDKETGHELEIDSDFIMSPKDLCTIAFIDKILNAGVTVLKIEGRARSPEYVRVVASCYAEAVEAYLTGTYNSEKIRSWETRLAEVFNRGFWDGYYLGHKTGEWSRIYGSSATKRKKYIARGVKYYSRIKVGEFLLENDQLSVGDEILIIGPTTGVIQMVVKEIHTDNGPVEKAVKGENFSIPVDKTVRSSDKLYKLVKTDKPGDIG
ncbi:MAG: collagenase [Bacteroides sp. SM23_62_1]|nr:MAG: collagenase [Bacteroides sp. SM23_62_1]